MYKKYTYRGGRRYGPYLYKNERVKGRVKTSYVGKLDNDSSLINPAFFVFGLFVVSLAIFIVMLALLTPVLTGNVTLDLFKTVYAPGEKIGGSAIITLESGELVPADSLVLVEMAGSSKSFVLKDIVQNVDLKQGNYYAQGISLEGSGPGFGSIGEKLIYPEIEFEIKVVSSQGGSDSGGQGSESNEGSDSVDSSGVGGSGSGQGIDGEVEIEGDGPSEPENDNPDSNGNGISSEPVSQYSSITGNVIAENEFIVEAKVSKNEIYSYDFSNYESAEYVSGSAKVNGRSIDDTKLEIQFEGKIILVSTNYSEIQEGFGEGYENGEPLEIVINFTDFNLVALEDTRLDMKIVSQDQVLVESKKSLAVDENALLNNQTLETLPINVSVNVTQYGAVLGRPVKWQTKVVVTDNEGKGSKVSVEVPASATNIQVIEVKESDSENQEEVVVPVLDITEEQESVNIEVNTDDGEANVESFEFSKNVLDSQGDEIDYSTSGITGNVVADISLDRAPEFSRAMTFLVKFLGFRNTITGNVVNDPETKNIEVSDSAVTEAVIEYETPAPYAIETENENSKVVEIISELRYENVLAFTEIPESFEVKSASNLRVTWVGGNEGQDVQVPITDSEDSDGSGFIDLVYWVAPHLSNQTFIIEIISAEHLDENRTFISDVYEQVSVLDGNYSEEIFDGEYVRVVFESELDSSKDITIYPKIISGNPTVEIYELGENISIAIFESLLDEQENKVFLTNLVGTQDSFDLRVLNGSVQFDLIIDPVVESNAPYVAFVNPTPSSNAGSSFVVNVSSSDVNSHYTLVEKDRDLLLWLGIDEGDLGDSTANDLSSYARSTDSTGVTEVSTGLFISNISAGFAGDAAIIVTSLNNYRLTKNHSISAWINVSNSANEQVIVAAASKTNVLVPSSSTQTQGWRFTVRNGALKYNYGDGVEAYGQDYDSPTALIGEDYDASNSISSGIWYHVVSSVYQEGGNYYTDLYINGNLVETLAFSSPSDSGVTPFWVGASYLDDAGSSTGEDLFVGQMDEIMLFNRTLTRGEIRSLYNASNYQYSNTFTLSDGNYNFTAHAKDYWGARNQTSRIISVEGTAPTAEYVSPTEESGSLVLDGSIDVNITASDSSGLGSIVVRFYNSSRSLLQTNTSSVSPFYVSYLTSNSGVYYFNATINDSVGNSVVLATRNVTVDSSIPQISFGDGTEPSGEVSTGGVYVNVSLIEDNVANVTYSLFNSSGIVNLTTYNTAVTSINFTGVSDGTYNYQVNVTDTGNNKNSTEIRAIKLVSSCLSQCAEGSGCTINSDCFLNNEICTDSRCDFANLTINAKVYTLFDDSRNGKNLSLSVAGAFNGTGNVNFSSGGAIIFRGKNGSIGGSGGVVNITAGGLFYRSRGFFDGRGAYSTGSGVAGGNGGAMYVTYHGLVGTSANSSNTFAAGNSTSLLSGTAGPALNLTKDTSVCPRDADIDGNGAVLVSGDITRIIANYNNLTSQTGIQTAWDINCDSKLSVIDVSRIGFSFGRGTS